MIILKNKQDVEEHYSMLISLVIQKCNSNGSDCKRCIMNKANTTNFCLRIHVRNILRRDSFESTVEFHKDYEIFYNILTLVDVDCQYKICSECPFKIRGECVLPELKKLLTLNYEGDKYDSR